MTLSKLKEIERAAVIRRLNQKSVDPNRSAVLRQTGRPGEPPKPEARSAAEILSQHFAELKKAVE